MMGAIPFPRSMPRGAPVEIDTPDVIAHGVARLREIGDDVMNLLIWLDAGWPDVLLPALTWAASRRSDISPRIVRALMKCCGEPMLERALGRQRVRQLKTRFPGWQDPSGLRGGVH